MHKKLGLLLNAHLLDIIHKEINRHGMITFERYMQLALYTPDLGYYTGDLKKFGKEGDFVTAPEISVLFTQCLAKQIQQILNSLEEGDLLEFGAGSGKMAVDLLTELEKLECLPKHYYILELSANLQERQKILFAKKIPHLLNRIQWLNSLPIGFKGAIVANEVLDAMPVHKFKLRRSADRFDIFNEIYVTHKNAQLRWQDDSPSSAELTQKITFIADMLNAYQEDGYDLPDEYESEINLILPNWLNALSQSIDQAMVILFDYGYPRHEYYHPQRASGTLMCHYQHRAHTDPLTLTGLQDITAHVDFSALAESAVAAGFSISGYTDQAHFLFNCGLIDLLNSNNAHPAETLAINQQVKLLTLPSEMGELVKVIALNKNIQLTPLGFKHNDKRAKLF